MEKVVRDGKVAVLISPEYGAGWYTWNHDKTLLFHPILVRMVEEGKQNEISSEFIENVFGIKGVYCGGVDSLCIKWIPIGTRFYIEEYDGAESIVTEERLFLIA